MREILDELLDNWSAGEPVALATVVSTFRSSPRLPGAAMMVTASGDVLGSVSGGCVEGDVYDCAQQVLATGDTTVRRYGLTDEDVGAIGLTCGGLLDVFIERIDPLTFPEFGEIATSIRTGRPVAVAVVIEHPEPATVGRRLVIRPADTSGPTASGTLGSAALDRIVIDDALEILAAGEDRALAYGPHGQRRAQGIRVFVWSFIAAPRMIVFGAIDFAAAAADIGAFLGYRVTVCDARPVFATHTRFPGAHEVVVDWPHRYLAAERDANRLDARTVICVLTHDPKFDVPVLEVALRLANVAYVGAMGSRRTHLDRMDRLRDAGLDDRELERLCSPIGLDLGARTPEETAVSIAAEIIASRWGAGGRHLSEMDGRIHATTKATDATVTLPPAHGHLQCGVSSADLGSGRPL